MLIGKRISDIVDSIVNKYEVNYDIAKKDILEFHRLLRIMALYFNSKDHYQYGFDKNLAERRIKHVCSEIRKKGQATHEEDCL